MTVDIVDDHKQKKQDHMGLMQRQTHYKQGEDANLHQGLPRVKRIRRPRRGIGGLVVNAMHPFVEPRKVHQPVRPIKIGIMQKQKDRKNQEIIKPTPLVG